MDRDGRNDLLNAIFNKDVDKSIKLIESNTYDLNQTDNNGYTALHAASQSLLIPVIEKLIEFKANVNARDKWGNPPILRALGNKEENTVIISLLLDAGADIHIVNKTGNSVATHVGKLKSHPNYEQLLEYL